MFLKMKYFTPVKYIYVRFLAYILMCVYLHFSFFYCLFLDSNNS